MILKGRKTNMITRRGSSTTTRLMSSLRAITMETVTEMGPMMLTGMIMKFLSISRTQSPQLKRSTKEVEYSSTKGTRVSKMVTRKTITFTEKKTRSSYQHRQSLE